MTLTPKKKQHYVPRRYLQNWQAKRSVKKSEKIEGIWVFNKKNQKSFFCTDLNSISQIRFFYRLDVDQTVYDMLVYKYHDAGSIPNIILKELQPFLAIEKYKKNKEDKYSELDILNKNYIEDKYEKIEKSLFNSVDKINYNIGDYINELTSGKADLRDLLAFYAIQFFRTKAIRDSIETEISSFSLQSKSEIVLSGEQKTNLIKIILFIESFVFSESLNKTDYSFELLINNSKKLFITSNSPAIMLNSNIQELTNIEGFMPLSPKVGMIVRGYKTGENNFLIKVVDELYVNYLNNAVYNFSEEIYASFDISSITSTSTTDAVTARDKYHDT